MKSALTRLTILLGASLILCVSSGTGVALAAKTKHRPTKTNPAQSQYVEKVPPTISGKRHTHGATKRHGSGTSTTTSGTTPHKHVSQTPPATGTNRAHHKTSSRNTKKHGGPTGKHRPTTSHKTQDPSSKRSHATTKLPTAVAGTGSGGGIGVWLWVILAAVLVSASAAGILRYRRNR